MTPRTRSTGGRRKVVLLSLVVALASAGLLPACLGSGDDNGVAPRAADGGGASDATQAGDSRPADAAIVDAHAEAAQDASAQDGGDATLQDAGSIDATVQDTGPALAPAVIGVSVAPIDFGPVDCAGSGTQTVNIRNTGGAPLVVQATTTGGAFAVSPPSLSVAHGATGTLTVTATVVGSATAGKAIKGSLNLFTSDTNSLSVVIQLSVTPSGATLASTTVTFPDTKTGTAADALPVTLANTGNAPVTVSIGAPTDAAFSLTGGAGVVIPGGGSWTGSAGFHPSTANAYQTTAAVTAMGGILCGDSGLKTISFHGKGTSAVISGWPAFTPPNAAPVTGIDWGVTPGTSMAECGGAAPAPYTFTLKNSGPVVAVVSSVPAVPGFVVTAGTPPHDPNGATIPAMDADAGAPGTLDIHVAPPPFPVQTGVDSGTPPGGWPAATTATLAMTIDTSPPKLLTLREEPSGASLKFETPTGFGIFPHPLVLLQPGVAEDFKVTNAGNEAAKVSLFITDKGSSDGGVAAGDAANVGGAPVPFTLNVLTQPLPNGPLTVPAAASGVAGSADDSVVFSPVVAGANSAQLSMAADLSTVLCAPLPVPIPLAGQGIGGGPSIEPPSLVFSIPCDGITQIASSFTIKNAGQLDMNWAMSGITGPGATFYRVSTVTQPPGNAAGLLHPGESAIVTVIPAAMPSAKVSAGGTATAAPTLAALAAEVTVTTDVPFDSPHVIALQEVPLGDRLSFSAGNLAFGQFPVGSTTVPQNFLVTNRANPGSPAANFSLTLQVVQDAGAPAYVLSPTSVTGLAPGGGGSTEHVTFTPVGNVVYPGAIAMVPNPSDLLCDPVPDPIHLSGTGTSGLPVVSPTTLTFGAPGDPAGLVDCGSTGTAQTFTVLNTGNQPFNIKSVALATGTYFTVSGAAGAPLALPLLVAPGTSATVLVTPKPIPFPLATNPTDPSPFQDTLTVITDAVGDQPHAIALKMQAHGAVIVDTQPPLRTTWDFGTVSVGSAGTITSVIQNTGNAAAVVGLRGLLFQSGTAGVFRLATSPTIAAPNSVSAVVGQFVPTVSNGSWVAQGTLSISPSTPLCAHLPAQWTDAAIALSGTSNSSPPVTATGSLAFAATNCGDGPPAPQSILLTNGTNTTYPITATLNVGTHYSVAVTADGGTATSGILPANGVANVVVTPQSLTTGPTVLAGSQPYADSLIVSVGNPVVWSSTFAISWTLNGAVFTLPDGAGNPPGNAFYVADSTTGFTFPINNSGNAAASVVMSPTGPFTVSPATVNVSPPSAPVLLTSASPAPACPASATGLTANGSVTFNYSGPVCRPLPVSSIQVYSCVGTFP